MKNYLKYIQALAVAAAIAAWPVLAGAATISVDGKYDPNEGYDQAYTVPFSDDKGNYYDSGKIYTYQDPDSSDFYMAFVMPKSVVDNTYGSGAVGWPGSNDKNPGGNHKFDHLVGSDKTRFTFMDGTGNVILDAYVDYLHEVGKKSGQYESGGVTDGDGSILVGNEGDFESIATSLDYNLNVAGYYLTQDSPSTDATYTANSQYPNWIYDVVYEMKIKGSAFSNVDLKSILIGDAHLSPAKADVTPGTPTPDPPPPGVPEPATMVLFGSGLAALGLGGWRKRRSMGRQ